MLNNRFKELAAQAWAEHPGASEEEFLEYYGRLIVDDCARACDNYVMMNIPPSMLSSLMRRQLGLA